MSSYCIKFVIRDKFAVRIYFLLWFNWSNWWTHFTCRSRVWLHVYDVYKVFTSSISLNFCTNWFLFSILIVYFLNKKIFCVLRIVLKNKPQQKYEWQKELFFSLKHSISKKNRTFENAIVQYEHIVAFQTAFEKLFVF